MSDKGKRTELLAEISLLLDQQKEAYDTAAFLGWTPATMAARDRRADRLESLRFQLAALDSLH
jgi:hypothetical protein